MQLGNFLQNLTPQLAQQSSKLGWNTIKTNYQAEQFIGLFLSGKPAKTLFRLHNHNFPGIN